MGSNRETLREVLATVSRDEETIKKFDEPKNIGELYVVCCKNGYEGTYDEFEEEFGELVIEYMDRNSLNPENSLDADDVENISGGKKGVFTALSLAALTALGPIAPGASAADNSAVGNVASAVTSPLKDKILSIIKGNKKAVIATTAGGLALVLGGGLIIPLSVIVPVAIKKKNDKKKNVSAIEERIGALGMKISLRVKKDDKFAEDKKFKGEVTKEFVGIVSDVCDKYKVDKQMKTAATSKDGIDKAITNNTVMAALRERLEGILKVVKDDKQKTEIQDLINACMKKPEEAGAQIQQPTNTEASKKAANATSQEEVDKIAKDATDKENTLNIQKDAKKVREYTDEEKAARLASITSNRPVVEETTKVMNVIREENIDLKTFLDKPLSTAFSAVVTIKNLDSAVLKEQEKLKRVNIITSEIYEESAKYLIRQFSASMKSLKTETSPFSLEGVDFGNMSSIEDFDANFVSSKFIPWMANHLTKFMGKISGVKTNEDLISKLSFIIKDAKERAILDARNISADVPDKEKHTVGGTIGKSIALKRLSQAQKDIKEGAKDSMTDTGRSGFGIDAAKKNLEGRMLLPCDSFLGKRKSFVGVIDRTGGPSDVKAFDTMIKGRLELEGKLLPLIITLRNYIKKDSNYKEEEAVSLCLRAWDLWKTLVGYLDKTSKKELSDPKLKGERELLLKGPLGIESKTSSNGSEIQIATTVDSLFPAGEEPSEKLLELEKACKRSQYVAASVINSMKSDGNLEMINGVEFSKEDLVKECQEFIANKKIPEWKPKA